MTRNRNFIFAELQIGRSTWRQRSQKKRFATVNNYGVFCGIARTGHSTEKILLVIIVVAVGSVGICCVLIPPIMLFFVVVPGAGVAVRCCRFFQKLLTLVLDF